MRRRNAVNLAAVLAILTLAACGTPRDFGAYQATIADFQTATDQTATVTSQYIGQINKFERDYEFARLRQDPARPLDIPGKLLRGPVTPEAIRARAEVFTVLKQYTDMLALLAGSDAGERWKAATGRLKESVDGLLGTIELNDAKLAALPLAQMTGPLKAVADVVGTAIINKKRSEALDAAIVKAAPQIDAISALLREDVAFVVRQRDSVNLLRIADLESEYVQAQQAGNESQRLQTLDRVDKALAARESDLGILQGLEQAVDRFDRAHDALVAYARSDKGAQDLSGLVATVEQYAALAQAIFETYRSVAEPPQSG